MKANYHKNRKDVVLTGQGKEWSGISNDILKQVNDWLAQSSLSENMFDVILNTQNILIDVVEIDEKKGIALIVNNTVIGCPLVYEQFDKDYDIKAFLADCTLFFLLIKSEYANNSVGFDKAIRKFFNRSAEIEHFFKEPMNKSRPAD